MTTQVYLSVVFVTLFCLGLQGQTTAEVETKGLTAEQVKALNAAADQLRKQPANTISNLSLENATPDKFREWAGVGEMAGKEISAFTKGVGIAADQFLRTDTGRLAMYSIIWKFGGNKVAESLLSIFLKLLFAMVLYTFWWKVVRRFVFNERKFGTVTYNKNPLLRWLGFNNKEVRFEKDESWMQGIGNDNSFWIMLWTRIGAGVAIVLITLACWPSVSF